MGIDQAKAIVAALPRRMPCISNDIAKILEFEESIDPKGYSSNVKFTRMDETDFGGTHILLRETLEAPRNCSKNA
jgi:hypothetical protein